MGLSDGACLDIISQEDSLFLEAKTFDLPYTPKNRKYSDSYN